MSGSPERQNKGRFGRLMDWFDSSLGLSHPLLRPVPQYAINPFYWLGALTVVAFVIQGVTGFMMMLYYIPTPDQAYSSTLAIFNTVYYGRFLETVHLYTAYAMIMLAFMHMMRGYFVSVHKKPRQLMWLTGMGMGFVTLGFGFTGYLLPWTVVSKSATDVGVGMLSALPAPISSFLDFLIVGTGGDTATLLRFYDLHIVILPAVLLVLLTLKMYMLETHGISDPATTGTPESKRRLIPIFPDVTLYLVGLAALFGSAMLLISVLFPLNLPPEYTPALASTYTPQPDWYFLWIYQVLKISIFEGPGLPVALTLVTLVFVGLFLLPFIDRGAERLPSHRRNFVTLGAIFMGELIVLAYWGLKTPGQTIPVEQAALILGSTALLIAGASFLCFRLFRRAAGKLPVAPTASIPARSVQAKTAALFVAILAAGTLGVGGAIDASVKLAVQGAALPVIAELAVSLSALAGSVLAACFLLYRLDLATGLIRKRVKAFERGWED